MNSSHFSLSDELILCYLVRFIILQNKRGRKRNLTRSARVKPHFSPCEDGFPVHDSLILPASIEKHFGIDEESMLDVWVMKEASITVVIQSE